jgi:ABC-2 type transport system ATP-binding protein
VEEGIGELHVGKLVGREVTEGMKAIAAEGLAKQYWFFEKEAGFAGSVKALFSGKKVFVDAVRGIRMDIDVGETVGFIGPNGAGKTTTLKMLAGILHPTAGRVEVVGHEPSRREKDFLKSIALITGQRNRLFWDLPAEEYFEFCKALYEIPEAVYARNRARLVELAEVGDILKVPQRKLSFGQRKRCELAAALLHDPRVIFLDEPTNAMDLLSARRLRRFIREMGTEGSRTIILTSHIMADIEEVCDRVIIINRGEIVYDGSTRDLSHGHDLKRQIRVVFSGPWNRDRVEKLGRVVEAVADEVLMEVEADRCVEVASQLLANLPVKDISISEPPLERIIEALYLKG